MKGKKVDRFDLGGDVSDDAVKATLGPTGNLRAPLIITGKTVLVGFNEDVFNEVFGA